MRPVSVRIMHPEPGPDAGPLVRWVAARRAPSPTGSARRSGRPVRPTSRSSRVRLTIDRSGRGCASSSVTERPAGLVVLGSGAIPLATARGPGRVRRDGRPDEHVALANNRYSADVVAIAHAEVLADLPDLPGDNALPRWLEEVAGVRRRRPARSSAAGVRRRRAARAGPARRPDPARGLSTCTRSRPGSGAPERSRRTGGRAAGQRPDLAGHAGLAGTGSQPHGSGRSSRSAGFGRRAGSRRQRNPAPGRPTAGRTDHPRPSSARRSSATGRRRSASTWLRCATAPSSTAGSCWPTGSEPTSDAGPGRRIALRVRPPARGSRSTTPGSAR